MGQSGALEGELKGARSRFVQPFGENFCGVL